MEPIAGAEPATSPLPRVCSTTELHGQPPCGSLKMERETGLEPATLCLEGRYSSQLSYSRSESHNQKAPFHRASLENWWTEKDSNLRRPKPADLQSAPFSHSGTCPQHSLEENRLTFALQTFGQYLELVMGLEPATC